MATRDVETFIATTDHRWETITVQIPADTPEAEVETTAIGATWMKLLESPDLPVAFVGVYHVPQLIEYEED